MSKRRGEGWANPARQPGLKQGCVALLMLAFLWQAYLGQTHIHLASPATTDPAFAALDRSAGSVDTPALGLARLPDATGETPADRPTDDHERTAHLCVLCLAGAIANAALLPHGPAIADPPPTSAHGVASHSILTRAARLVPAARAPPLPSIYA